nr:hypothetical protein [Tanacetum cinerariifolium]
MHKAFPLPVMEFPLSEEVSTASEESSHCQKKRDATAEKIVLLLKSSSNSSVSDKTGKKKGRIVTLTLDDMQKRKNDVKARTTLLLAIPDEHQLWFNKHKTAQESWAAILKTFSGNEATKKTKKNLLKQQYGNFKGKGSETLEQTFNRLQKKSKSNSQNMAFASSAKHNSRNEEVNTASISTASTNVSTASANIGAASISQDTACAYNASQSNGSAGLPEAKTEKGETTTDKGLKESCIVADEEAPTEFVLMAKTSAESEVFDNSLCSKAFEARLAEHRNQEVKYCEKIRVLEFKVESRANCIESLTKELELIKKEKEGLDSKLAGFQTASKDLDSLLESQRLDKNKEGLGYSAVPPPPAQVYSPPKKDLSWTGLSKFANDTVTDYSRPSPDIESTSDDAQNRNPSVTEPEASPSTISPKPFIKFVKATDRLTETKTAKVKTAKPVVKYAAMYNKPSKSSNIKGNQRNWNNLKSHQLGVKKGRTCPTNSHKTISPRTVIHKPYRPLMRPMRPNMNVAHPNRTTFNKPAHSYAKRPFQRTSVVRPQFRGPRVPTVTRKFPTITRKYITVNRKFPTGNTKFPTADQGNISYLSDYETFDGGYVSFGQGGQQDYWQRNNQNCVLLIDSEYIVLGRDFKLLDDANVLLRTPRQHNVYSINLNNIVPHKDLNCLVAKASVDEGKQHKASCKSKLVNSVTKHLHTLYMDLFGPTSVSSISHKWYCLVVTDDFSRFTWTFFLKTKDETSGILRKFIPEIENLKDLKVKIIRTLIEAARTMLDDAKLPVTFWAKVVNTACYVQNRVLVNKSQNKTPYELFNGRTPAIGYLKPFGCHVMILNTLDNLGKFEEKGDEGYFIGYSMSSKAFMVFNKRTKRVKKNLHVEFLENKTIEKGVGLNWLFDIDSLTNSMNYVPVVSAGTHPTNFSGTKDAASQEVKKDVSSLRYIALALLESTSSNAQDTCKADAPESSGNPNLTVFTTNPQADPMETLAVETLIPTVSSPVPTTCLNDSQELSSETILISKRVANQVETSSLDNILTLTNQFEDILGVTTNL